MSIFGRHDLRLDEMGHIRCAACGGSWKHAPSGGCPAQRTPSALNRRPQPRPLCRQCAQVPVARDGVCLDCRHLPAPCRLPTAQRARIGVPARRQAAGREAQL
jgi:hypothetical protein